MAGINPHAFDFDGAGIAIIQEAQDVEQCAFPAATLACDADQFAFLHLEVCAIQHGDAAMRILIYFTDVLCAKNHLLGFLRGCE